MTARVLIHTCVNYKSGLLDGEMANVEVMLKLMID